MFESLSSRPRWPSFNCRRHYSRLFTTQSFQLKLKVADTGKLETKTFVLSLQQIILYHITTNSFVSDESEIFLCWDCGWWWWLSWWRNQSGVVDTITVTSHNILIHTHSAWPAWTWAPRHTPTALPCLLYIFLSSKYCHTFSIYADNSIYARYSWHYFLKWGIVKTIITSEIFIFNLSSSKNRISIDNSQVFVWSASPRYPYQL